MATTAYIIPNTAAGIRALRSRLGLTQRQFAAAIGVSVYTVRAWEQGQLAPGADKVARMEALQHDRAVRTRDAVAAIREAAATLDLDAIHAGEGPSTIAAALRSLADRAEAELTR